MDKITILSTLRQDMIAFVDELRTILPGDKELMVMKPFLRVVIMSDVINYINRNIVPLEDKVIKREEEYFLKNAVMFENLQERSSTVNHFKTIWETTDDPHNKEVVWEWIHHFIKLAKKYSDL
jgi:hypothetical protein